MSNVHRDYYEVLGVLRTANATEIKQAFRKLSRRYHPDRAPDDPEALRLFKEAAEAYATLSDSGRRRRYDRGIEIRYVRDVFEHLPVGSALLAAMLPSAPAAVKPGVDTIQVVEVDPTILQSGGVVEVSGIGPIQIPERADCTPWCRLPGLGEPGRNHGPPGDAFVLFLTKP